MAFRRRPPEFKPIPRWHAVVGVILPLICLLVLVGIIWGVTAADASEDKPSTPTEESAPG
jgi:hypothetical protein